MDPVLNMNLTVKVWHGEVYHCWDENGFIIRATCHSYTSCSVLKSRIRVSSIKFVCANQENPIQVNVVLPLA